MPPGFRRLRARFGADEIEYSAAKSEWTLANQGFDFEFAGRIFTAEVLTRRDTRHREEASH